MTDKRNGFTKRKKRFRYISIFMSLLILLFNNIALAETEKKEIVPKDPFYEKLYERLKEKTVNRFPFLSKLKLNGYRKNETAYRLVEPRSFTKIRNIISLDLKYPFTSSFQMFFSGWAYYDTVYDFLSYDSITARSTRNDSDPLVFIEELKEEKDSPVVDAREAYLDLFSDNFDIRMGKQYIIWGVLEGNRITDEINPMDFRELILPDLLDFRIALWSLKVDYFFRDSSLQLIWIPDIRFHKPAPEGSEWELLQKVPGTTFPKSWVPENSELGAKWSTTIFNADISLSYFYTWDDFPVVFRTIKMRSRFLADSTVDPVFNPTYTRISMYGTTFSKKVWPVILKGEAVYITDKFFGTMLIDADGDGFLDKKGERKKNHIRWGIGIDFNILNTDFSPAFVQWIVLNYEEPILTEQFDSSFSIFIRKEFPPSTVFQMLALRLITLGETLLKPKITTKLSDKFQVAVGLDLIFGKKTQTGVRAVRGQVTNLQSVESRFQFLGNFLNNDRAYIEFKYFF